MNPRITTDMLEAYLHCRYKGHLRQAGEPGRQSDYEVVSAELRADVRRQAVDRIVARHAGGEVISNAPLTAPTLRSGPAFVLDALLEDDTFALRFDGVKRVDGPPRLGDYHYVPVLFHGGASVRKEQRLALDVCGLLLSRIQGRMPGHGIVWHGRDCRATRVRLSPDPRKAERLLRDLQRTRPADHVLDRLSKLVALPAVWRSYHAAYIATRPTTRPRHTSALAAAPRTLLPQRPRRPRLL
jgi:hypothetical protein